MFLRVLGSILEAPFKILNMILGEIFFPAKAPRHLEDYYDDLKKENKKIRGALYVQSNHSQILESEIMQMAREHQRSQDNLRKYYEAKIRELVRQQERERKRQ